MTATPTTIHPESVAACILRDIGDLGAAHRYAAKVAATMQRAESVAGVRNPMTQEYIEAERALRGLLDRGESWHG